MWHLHEDERGLVVSRKVERVLLGGAYKPLVVVRRRIDQMRDKFFTRPSAWQSASRTQAVPHEGEHGFRDIDNVGETDCLRFHEFCGRNKNYSRLLS